MKVLHLLLVAVVGLLLIELAVAAAATGKPSSTQPQGVCEGGQCDGSAKDAAKAPKETVKEAVKEAVKETVKESVKEPVKAKETVKEAVKETVKEVKEPVKEAVKDAKETVKETVKEVKEPVKETVKDAKEAVKETVKEVKEPVKETVKEVKETVKEAVKEPVKKAEETVKEATKAKETPKEAPKDSKKDAKDVPKFPKEEPKGEASFLDVYPYAQKAYELTLVYGQEAAKYGEVAWKEAKKYGGASAILAQEYSVTLSEAVADYKALLEDYTYRNSLELVDKFLDPQHAQIVKKNYLNWYGVAIVCADIFAVFLIVKHLRWVFSLSALRLFLSAVNLGIYATLATLTILTSEAPTKGINAAALANLHQGLFYASIVSTALNVLALVVFPGRVKSFVVALLSVGLFIDILDLRSPLESAVGSIPAYSLEALIFLLQAIFVFDSIATTQPYSLKSSSAIPSLIKYPNNHGSIIFSMTTK